MRTKLNFDSSTDRRIAGKLAMSGISLSGMPMSGMRASGIQASGIQMEWLDAGSWRLPSGKALAEFALQAGFLAPPLFNVERFGGLPPGSVARDSSVARSSSEALDQSEALDSSDAPNSSARVKQCGKGSGE